MDTSQKFSLGNLVGVGTSQAPSEVSLSLEGRGIFCRLRIELTFATDNPSSPRALVMDRPWNAVLTGVTLNAEQVNPGTSGMPSKLSGSMRQTLEAELHEGSPEAIVCYFEAGQSVRTVAMEFTMACDVLWHKSHLVFKSISGTTDVTIQANWDLNGLPGAHMQCTGAGAESRFSALDGARQNWSETLRLTGGNEVGILLALDEKKAASLCLHSDTKSPGCGAVVVVAPVRPQLVRKPVKISVVVEVRNPQEGLIARDLVDELSSSLNPNDLLSIFFMGSTFTRQILEWTEAANLQEDTLAHLLEPQHMGRTQYFWESFQRVIPDCHDATHLLLVTPGSSDEMPSDIACNLPVFGFATGRKPNSSGLEGLAMKTGGFLSENCIDGIDSFLKRINIRLSPPLLRDFRLEGWGLENVYPPGLTQVYTDKPTLVLGQYDGLLPQTVTLGGYSPAGQKLAQRVRVEKFSTFDLSPLYDRRVRPVGESVKALRGFWSHQDFSLVEVVRPFPLEEFFLLEDNEPEAGLNAPPSIDIVSSAVTMDNEVDLFAGSESNNDEVFSGSGESDFFAQSDDDGPTFLDETPDSSATLGVGGGMDVMVNPDDLDFGQSDEVTSQLSLTKHGGEVIDSVLPTPGESVSSDTIGVQFDQPSDVGYDTLSGPAPLAPVEGETFDSGATFDSSSQMSHPEVSSGSERATLMVETNVPGWVRKLTELDTARIGDCLSACPIDPLAMALVDTDDALADTFLSKLSEKRQMAVKVQMELGKLLSQEERLEASVQLEEHIKSHAHS